MSEKNDLIQVSGLWSKTDRNGNPYLTGNLSPQCGIVIMKNKYKKTDNHPDWIMYYSKREKRENQNTSATAAAQSFPKNSPQLQGSQITRGVDPDPWGPALDEDIPF